MSLERTEGGSRYLIIASSIRPTGTGWGIGSLINYREANHLRLLFFPLSVVFMAITIPLNLECLQQLDLSPAQTAIDSLLQLPALSADGQLRFEIDYPREPEDPRELSEIPELRLWFIRLDARYPWLPILLDWKAGELARYVAMLVPHQFHRTEGIQFNPEALEIFLMQKIFASADWLHRQGVPSKSKLMSMAQTLGYDLDESLFDLISNPNS